MSASVLILWSSISTDARTRRLEDLLISRKCIIDKIDGADPENKEIRNNLFSISGLRAKYPQCFINIDGAFKYVGQWEAIETLEECDSLPPDVLLAHPEIDTFTKVFFQSNNPQVGILISQEKSRLAAIAKKEEEQRQAAILFEKQREIDDEKERLSSIVIQDQNETLECIALKREKLRQSLSALSLDNMAALAEIQHHIHDEEEARMAVLLIEFNGKSRVEEEISSRKYSLDNSGETELELIEEGDEEDQEDDNDDEERKEERKDNRKEEEEIVKETIVIQIDKGRRASRLSLEASRARTASVFLEIEELERQQEEAENKIIQRRRESMERAKAANNSGKSGVTDGCSPDSIADNIADNITEKSEKSSPVPTLNFEINTKNIRGNGGYGVDLGEWADSPLDSQRKADAILSARASAIGSPRGSVGGSFKGDELIGGIGGIGGGVLSRGNSSYELGDEDEEEDDDDDDDQESTVLSLVTLLGPRPDPPAATSPVRTRS